MNDDVFKYFMIQTKEDLEYIRKRVDKLWDWRLMVIGGSFVISAIASTITVLIFEVYLRNHG